MSSAQNKSRQSSQSASSPEPKTDAQAHSVSQPPSSEENAMDQPLDSTLTAIPPAPPTPSAIMSSTDSSSPDSTPTPDSAPTPAAETPTAEVAPTVVPNQLSDQSLDSSDDAQAAAARLQPIPPASEPMQYRAIGLVRGQYVASDDQFTRGSILTDDGYEIGAVLLGRVMSLVKKHVDLEQPHLWVVYPRTREKGDSDLHVQIVGVWEPESLNRMIDSSELESDESDDLDELELGDADLDESELDESELDESELDEPELDELVDAELDEPELDEPELNGTELADADLVEAVAATENTEEEEVSPSGEEPQNELSSPENNAVPPIPAADLDDKYFSVRGEVVYQSIEEQQILVKIRRIPRPGTDQSKAFKVVLQGALEGKAVGYFWDLHVQRQGNILVVQQGTMIAAVPPQKRDKKPPFNRRGGSSGGYRSGGSRPPQSGAPRKPWQNREGQPLPRPSRSGERSDRPILPPNRSENRPPSPRPVKRRNPEMPEG